MERRQLNVPALDAFDPLLFERNENDQITLKHGGALFVSEDSGLRIRTDGSSLVERNASPVALQSIVKPTDMRAVEQRATDQSTTSARLSSALATKAPLVHTHAEADVTGLTAALAGKASTTHTHNAGFATLVAGTIDVVLASITAGSVVLYAVKTLAGTPGSLSYTVTAGMGFTLNSTSATDTSEIGYAVLIL